MSVSLTRSNATDSYDVLSSYTATSDQTEVSIVDILVKGNLGQITNEQITTPANNVSWDYTKLSNDYVDTSVISNYPPGTLPDQSVISLEQNQPSQLQSYTVDLANKQVGGGVGVKGGGGGVKGGGGGYYGGGGKDPLPTNPSVFRMLPDSSPIYDANYVIQQSYLSNFFNNAVSNNGSTPEGAKYKVTFDTANTNFTNQYAVSSRWNTTLDFNNSLTNVGQDPIAVSEDADFNTQKTFGMCEEMGTADYVSNYALPDNTGKMVLTPIRNENQPLSNNLKVISAMSTDLATFSNIVDNETGIYMFNQGTNEVTINVELGGGLPVSARDYVGTIPLMNANGTASGSLEPSTQQSDVVLPASLSQQQFLSLFNTAVANTVCNDYEFNVSITTSTNSGYSFSEAEIVELYNENEDNTPITTSGLEVLITAIDDSGLNDAPYYMENYVSENHSILFSDATLTIEAATNGSTSNVGLMTIDLSIGEKLQQQNAGQNGKILLNVGTQTSRTKDFVNEGFGDVQQTDVNVCYAGSNVISSDMKTNSYVRIDYDKVGLRSSVEPTINVFKSSNNSFLTLYTDEVVNNEVVDGNTTFVFNNSSFINDDIHLWRVDVQNSLVANPNSFCRSYDETDNNGVNQVDGIVVQSYLQNLTESFTETYQSYRCTLTAKTLEDIGLSTAVNNSANSNWTIDYSNESDTFLTSNSSMAFNDEGSLPNYSITLINNLKNGSNLYFSYDYSTLQTSATYGGLRDSVKVSYSLNEDLSNSTEFIIPQTDITRVYSSAPATTITLVTTPYQFAANSIYSSEHWQLVSVDQISTFDAFFGAKYSVFDNIKLKIGSLVQTDTYYALQNKSSMALAPHTSLQNVVGSNIANLLTVNETITAPHNGSTSISGVFTINDLKAFKAVIQGKRDSDNVWTSVSDNIDFDAYYGLDNINTLSIRSNTGTANPDVSTQCEFSPFTTLEQIVKLYNNNYYIPFSYNPNDNNYILSSFTSSPSNLANTTTLSTVNNSYLTVTDNYAATNAGSWVTTDYTISVTDDVVNNTTTFNVKNTNNDEIFRITRESTTPFLGTMIVSYITKDVIKSILTKGTSLGYSNQTIKYELTSYTDGSMIIRNTPGIVVNVPNTITPAGGKMSFQLKGDSLTINPIGTTVSQPNDSNELGTSGYNSGSLTFQYEADPDYYSAPISFSLYRGYYETTLVGQDQQYTINRDSTQVTFNVGTSLQDQLTSNMYCGEVMTVNNLVNGSSVKVADLGISFTAIYSLPPSNQPLTYPVSVVGDAVTVSIKNPEYTGPETPVAVPAGSTPVTNPKFYTGSCTLKDYAQNAAYTFSGPFGTSQEVLACRFSRVKLQTNAFDYSSLTYSIKYTIAALKVYKLAAPLIAGTRQHLGNPENTLPLVDAEVDPTTWTLMTSLTTTSDRNKGYRVGKIKISQDSAKLVKPGVSLIVSLPPHLKFETVSTENLITPYNYNNLNTSNKKVAYMPYSNSGIYNPFAPSIPIKDINGNDYSITNDSRYVNNLTFTSLQTKSALQLSNIDEESNDDPSSDSTRYSIIVPGTKLSITLNTGLYPSTLQSALLYEAPVTSMPSILDISANPVIFKGRDTNGAIKFSLIQNPTVIGYSTGLQGYQEVFRTTDQSAYYNNDLSIGNPCWFNNNSPITYFNANADGIRPTLYTVRNLNNPSTKFNYRRVYKYNSTQSFNIQDTTTLQTLSFSFTLGRKYYDVVVNRPSFQVNENQSWNYMDLVASTNIGTDVSSIAWTDDEEFSGSVFVNWAFGNADTATQMPIDLFYVEKGMKKIDFINLLPFQKLVNQFGLTVGGISWDGSVYAPLISTQIVSLNAQLSSPALDGSTYQTEQYSVSTLMK